MGLGVLDDPHMAAPPGTYTIGANDGIHGLVYSMNFTDQFLAEAQANDSSLKRDGDIILQPQPSDDPNDPLNW